MGELTDADLNHLERVLLQKATRGEVASSEAAMRLYREVRRLRAENGQMHADIRTMLNENADRHAEVARLREGIKAWWDDLNQQSVTDADRTLYELLDDTEG